MSLIHEDMEEEYGLFMIYIYIYIYIYIIFFLLFWWLSLKVMQWWII
ncbi:MAG: hypothetical protein N7Q72_07530 [Spiroplasma sp. Tabriz.8]|nr:hypothetical protein [Spiroplasma sp. Tabriz.8]